MSAGRPIHQELDIKHCLRSRLRAHRSLSAPSAIGCCALRNLASGFRTLTKARQQPLLRTWDPVFSDGQQIVSDQTNARRCILVALALTAAVNAPMLVLNTDTVFIDDWAFVWLNYWRGGGGVRDVYWQAAHPWFGPLTNLLFLVGGEVPGQFARALALLFHLGNGWLLWQIFKTGRSTPAFAAIVAVLYLASPFLGAPRATFNLYDIFIFVYLVSIWLSGRQGVVSFAASLVMTFIGLAVETLAALEAVRWWYLYQRGFGFRAAMQRAGPCLLIVLAVAVSRATWEAPYGEIYGGHNSIKPFDLQEFVRHVFLHLIYYIRALQPARYVLDLVVYDNLLLGGLIALGAIAVGYWQFRTRGGVVRGELARLFLLGLTVLAVGMLPYIIVRENPPAWMGFYAYLAVASQFGVLILAAAVISIIPRPVLRGAMLGLAAFVFSAMELQFGKWAMYDGQVVLDFRSQLAAEFKNHPNELLFVRFRPASWDVLFVKTCLANYAINVPLDIRNLRNGSSAYDQDCQAEYYTADGKCGVTAYERVPCPPKSMAEFRIDPGMESFTRFRLFDLASRTLLQVDLDLGTLVVDRTRIPRITESDDGLAQFRGSESGVSAAGRGESARRPCEAP